MKIDKHHINLILPIHDNNLLKHFSFLKITRGSWPSCKFYLIVLLPAFRDFYIQENTNNLKTNVKIKFKFVFIGNILKKCTKPKHFLRQYFLLKLNCLLRCILVSFGSNDLLTISITTTFWNLSLYHGRIKMLRLIKFPLSLSNTVKLGYKEQLGVGHFVL
jgi:hypothetical protein